jgi:hypothetical protein
MAVVNAAVSEVSRNSSDGSKGVVDAYMMAVLA